MKHIKKLICIFCTALLCVCAFVIPSFAFSNPSDVCTSGTEIYQITFTFSGSPSVCTFTDSNGNSEVVDSWENFSVEEPEKWSSVGFSFYDFQEYDYLSLGYSTVNMNDNYYALETIDFVYASGYNYALLGEHDFGTIYPISYDMCDLIVSFTVCDYPSFAEHQDCSITVSIYGYNIISSSSDVSYQQGYDEGQSAGYTSGFEEGEAKGYEKGKQDGFAEGVKEAPQYVYDQGYLAGKLENSMEEYAKDINANEGTLVQGFLSGMWNGATNFVQSLLTGITFSGLSLMNIVATGLAIMIAVFIIKMVKG